MVGDDQAYAIARDSQGSVYVVGTSYRDKGGGEVDFDYAIIKYDRNGNRAWLPYQPLTKGVIYYDGQASAIMGSADVATAVAVWEEPEFPYRLFVHVTGYEERGDGFPQHTDWVTLKLHAETGDRSNEWDNPIGIRRYNVPDVVKENKPWAIGADSHGHCFITGQSVRMNIDLIDNDYCTLVYERQNNAGGSQLGGRAALDYFDSPDQTNADDIAVGLVIDDLEDVYVTGSSFHLDGPFPYNFLDANTLKYRYVPGNPQLQRLWGGGYRRVENVWAGGRKPKPSIAENVVFGPCIALGSDRSPHVVGTLGDPYQNHFISLRLIKYDTNGNQLWLAAGAVESGGVSVAVDKRPSAGDPVYATGYAGEDGASTFATWKYNSQGALQWERLIQGDGTQWQKGHAVGLDGCGNIFVTGQINRTTTALDYLTAKYNSAGDQLWSDEYFGTQAVQRDAPRSLTVFEGAAVVPTGASWQTATSDDFATLRYHPRFAPLTEPVIVLGTYLSGNRQSLLAVDTDYYKLRSGPEEECRFVTTTTVCVASYASGRIKVRTKTTLPGTKIRVEVYKYTFTPNPWIPVYNAFANTTGDIDIDVPLPTPLANYIDPVTKEMKVRVRNYKSLTGFGPTMDFEQWTDFIEWTLVP